MALSLSLSAAIVTGWYLSIHTGLSFLLFMPPTPCWPQSKGQIAECPVQSRTHYTRLETEREQRSLCDTVGHSQTQPTQPKRRSDELFSAMIKGIKSTNKK